MERKCAKCGYKLQENDFLCPKCGAIYGEPVYKAPKLAKKPATAANQRIGGRMAVFAGIALVIVLACWILWDPFRPAETLPSTAPSATTAVPTVPTTWRPILPTETSPPKQPGFDPAALAAQIPENVKQKMRIVFLRHDSKLMFRDESDVRIERVFGIFGGAYVLFVDMDDYYVLNATSQTVKNMEFRYKDGQTMLVYYEEQYYRFHEALTMGIVSPEQFGQVFENYYNAYPDIEKPVVEEYIPDILAAQIPQELQMEMKRAYVDACSYGYFGVEDVQMEYLAILEEAYVFVADGWDSEDLFRQTVYGYTFVLPGGSVYAYADGCIYSLEEAINAQVVSLEELAEIHAVFYEVYIGVEQPKTQTLYATLLAQIPDAVQRRIRLDYLAQFVNPTYNLTVKDITLKVYGVFEDAYALVPRELGFGGDSYIYDEAVNGLVFRYSDLEPLYIYHDGQFVSITAAFNGHIISEADLLELYENYYSIHTDWKPTETPPPVETVTDAEILEVYNQWFYGGRGDVSTCNVEHYGQYGGAYAVIVRDPLKQESYVDMDIVGDMLFHYDTAENLKVYWNGYFYRMWEALDAGVLTYTNVREIYQQHKERYPWLYTPPSPNMQMPEIDAETEQFLKQRYVELRLPHVENPDIDQLDIDVYWECNGEYVLCVHSPYAMPYEELQQAQLLLGHYTFLPKENAGVLVYFYDAEGNGHFGLLGRCFYEVLNHPDIPPLFELYRQQNWELYYPDAAAPVDWYTVDWETFDWNTFDANSLHTLADWMAHYASTEALIAMGASEPDGANATSYALYLGQRFVEDPVALIHLLSQKDTQTQKTIGNYIAFSDAFDVIDISFHSFVNSIQLPENATAAERDCLQKLIEVADSLQIPEIM